MPLLTFLRQSAVVLPAMILLGHAPAVVFPTTSTALATPQKLVAEAPIWGADSGAKGYAFLPVTVHGHAATVVINLDDEGDLTLSTAALAGMSVTLSDTSQLDSLTIGTDVQKHIPIRLIRRSNWTVRRPSTLPPVVGTVGAHFLTNHYDLLYDFPRRLVQLYAFPPSTTGKHEVWLPPGIKPADCGKSVPIPPGGAVYMGMALQLDGHPVTGALEMVPYGLEDDRDEKMNQAAFHTMGLTEQSPRIQPAQHNAEHQVADVHVTIGQHNFWTGPVKIFSTPFVVEKVLPPNTPVMLINHMTIRRLVVFNSVSSGQVCLSTP